MIHDSKTWLLTKINLQRNDRAMIRLICSIKPEGEGEGAGRPRNLLGKTVMSGRQLTLKKGAPGDQV